MFNPQQKDLSCPEVSGNNSDKCAILIHPTTSHIGESEELATLTLPPQGERIEFEGKKKRLTNLARRKSIQLLHATIC